MIEYLQVVNTNPLIFCQELQAAVKDGYVIDEKRDFAMYRNLFTIGMMREKVFPEDAVLEDSPKGIVEKVEVKAVGRPKKDK